MKKVVIYTTPTCTYCRQTKEFFREKGVVYEEYDVAANAARREEMIEKSGQMGVPVIAISNGGDSPAGEPEEQIIIGYNRRGLESALGLTA